MSDQTPDADEQNLIVNQLIADFISRRNAGEQLSIEEFVAEHPEHTDELKRQFANDSALKAFKEPDKTDVAETIVGSGNAGGISAEDATAQTVVGGSDTSVTQSHQQRNTGSTTSIEIPENFGRYAIQKVLGQGAMGAVYLAKDTQLDRDVALKIPKFGDENGVDDEELLARFYREARASATIRSLNICPVYDVGEIDGQHYITMAFIKGRPLKDYTQSKKSHPEKQIISTIRKLASGLAEAHKIGVVHRDLKPANIMVDENGEPVVMDFGLARRSSSDDVQVTQSGAILGTPAYMSPEQIEGDQSVIGPQTDIYALGVIMYELITGEMPFKGSLITLISQIAANNPAKPSKLRKNIDPRLETICLKMMESDLGQRYQSMTEVADDLQDVLRNPGKQQTKEQAKKKGPKPTSLPSAGEESNPALISIEQPKSYAEQLRERKGKRSRKKSKVTSKTKSKSKATAKSGSRSSGPSKNLLIAGGVGGLLLLLGIFYLVRGGNHDVQITSDDPDIKQSVAVLKESSGNGHDGKITGAKRVEVDNDTSQPIDLLADLVPTAMNSKDLNWQMKDGVLSCSSTSSSATKKKKWVGATFPQKISGDADFDLELKQMGFAPLQIDLPLGDKQAIRLHLGGLGCALMEIDGKGDRDVDPEYRNTDVKLKRNVWQRLTAQVRHHGENIDVDVALDGIRIGRFSGLRSRITLPSWIKPDPVHVKFAGNGDLSAIQLEFRRALVTPISSVASPSGNRSDGEAIVASPPPLAVAPFDAIQAKQHQQAWADYLGLPVEKKVTLPGGQKMTFMLIPPGEFMMGSTEEERSQIIKEHSSFPAFKGILAAEGPQHRVQISRPFYLGKYEVIQSQWLAVMGINPPGKQSQGSSSHPAESISWNETQAFFKKFNQGSCPATMRGMLPTEAQWEYACRAGTSTSWSFGDREADVKNHAWFDANSNSQTQPVGKLPPNHFGLHDMHGNVGEWCFDSPSSSFYGQSKLRDPVAGDLNSPKHIYRGGNVYLNPVWCRSAFRANQSSDTKKMRLGFRATMEIDVTKLKEKTTATTQNPVKSPSDGESTSVSLLEMLTSSEYEWTEPVNLGPQINSDQGDNHPTASGDGLILMFESDRDLNTIRLFECSRSSIDEPWSTPRAIDELNRIMATDPKLSHDGLSLLFISPRGGKKQDLFLSRRSKRDAPWQDPVNLGPEVNSSELQGGGGFSPDGLTVYFKRPKKGNTTLKFSDMWRAQRSAVDAPWEKAASLGPEINLDDGGGTAEVQPLADGKSLLFTHNKRLFLAQRDDTGKFQVRKLETKTLFYNFTLTDNGTLLFTSQMQGGIGKGDLWMSRRVRKD